MKCPHCNYIDGYDLDENDNYIETVGEDGCFWELPVKMEQQKAFYSDGHRLAKLLACPSCLMTFIFE
jgi:hypothetical protein